MVKNDRGLEVLMSVRKKQYPDLNSDLLRRCFEVQMEYLFDEDEVIPSNKMKLLVEDYVSLVISESK